MLDDNFDEAMNGWRAYADRLSDRIAYHQNGIQWLYENYEQRLAEKDDEIARLRARIAELEQWTPTPRVTFDPTRVTSISSGAVVCENMTLMEKKKKK